MKLLYIILIIIFSVAAALYLYREKKKREKMTSLESAPVIEELRNHLRPMFGAQIDEIPITGGDSSYTEDKEKIVLCTSRKEKIYDINLLTYVLLHEFAHMMCDEHGHTPKFMKIFAKLLNQATALGLYDPKMPLKDKEYCR